MTDLLLELFSEEIPARMQADALAHLQAALAAKLKESGIIAEAGQGFVTPRRLAVWIKNLPKEQAATETEVKGPKVGAPEAALQGFLKKSGLAQKDLSERDGVYFAVIKKESKKITELLKPIIEEILSAFPWPKSMRWGNGDTTWVRPLHSILCIFDGAIVPVSFAGITASHITYGHRFLAPQKIMVTNPADYATSLEKAFVIADREKRKASILEQAQKAAQAAGLVLKKDDGLLEEVTGLVEWPVVLTGSIDAKYMDLPKEVLVSEMRAHQKYFALEKADGALSDKFLITSNMNSSDGGKAIIAGNERVLRARLSDGRFFWDQDRKKPLSDWAEGLKTVTFHAKLGTIADKVQRIEVLALQLADHVKGADKKLVAQAARLCKADLTTGMVGEFPELQGVMGRYYAVAQKEDAAVADAIRDHYKPQGPGDSVPSNPVSICVALADKLDTLVSMFAIGEKPTGSKDPFALRRSALGIIRIILDRGIHFNLNIIIDRTWDGIRNSRPPSATISGLPEPIKKEIFTFFIDRLKVQLKDSGIRHDVINAVVAGGDEDLVRIFERAKALQAFLATDDGNNLLIAYKRAANIVNIAEKEEKTTYTGENDIGGFFDKDEHSLALAQALTTTLTAMKQYRDSEKFSEMMLHAANLRKPIDGFFTYVLVNADDKELRKSRLSKLAWIRDAFNVIADFSKIEGEAKEQKKAA